MVFGIVGLVFNILTQERVSGINSKCDLDVFTKEILLSNNTISIPSKPNNSTTSQSSDLTYTVKPGDTLSGIAEKFNTTVYSLSKLNDITNPNLIYPGQVLKIRPSSTYKVYTVKKGDTLSGIANKFNTTVYHIAKLNNISDPNLIYPGQVLKL